MFWAFAVGLTLVGAIVGWYEQSLQGLVVGAVVGLGVGTFYGWAAGWLQRDGAERAARECWLPKRRLELDPRTVRAFEAELRIDLTNPAPVLEPLVREMAVFGPSPRSPIHITRTVLATVLAARLQLVEGKEGRVDLPAGVAFVEATPVAVVALPSHSEAFTRALFSLTAEPPSWAVLFAHRPDRTEVRTCEPRPAIG